MKIIRKVAIVIAICTLVFVCGTQQAFAASIDGLEVVIATDQQEYKETDDITATITITNRNDGPITNISLKSLVPEGYELKKDGTNIFVIESLLPDETVSFTVALDSLKEDKGFVRTVLYALLGGVVLGGVTIVVIFVVRKKKRTMRTVITAMIAAVLSGLITPAFAATPQSKMTIVHTVRAGNAEVSLNMLLSYDPVLGNNEFLGMDTDKMLYDMTTDTYYNHAPMPVFSGTLLEADNVASMVCTVTDAQGNLLLEKNILPANFWSVNDFAMIVGVNHVRIAVAYQNGNTYEKTLTINNICAENMAMLNVDQGDDDEDGVLNFIERMYHTDPQKADTDGDGLSDYDEMAVLGTDSNLVDTDENGVSDAAEDADADQLSNLDEIALYMTSPICADSDGDNLSDWDEIRIHLTDPNKADSDGDGAKDDWELENGYNPLAFDEDLPRDVTEVIPDNVVVESEGEVSVILLTDHELINEDTLGYIGQDPVYIQVEEGYSANISMSYDQTQLEEGDEPALYYFDEQTQCYEQIESIIDENSKVVACVNRSGVYVLLNHRLVNDVWENDISRPSDFVEDGTIDVVFVIDRSYSMYDNDPQELRKLVTKEFINKLRDNIDRAAIVQFTAVAELIMTLSYDKEALCNAVDAIQNSDGGGCNGTDPTPGTNGSAGIRAAINELANSEARYKYIVFLTDGADTEVAEDYGDEAGTTGLTGEAKEKGIVIHTVGLVGTSEVDVELLKRVAKGTGGNYYLATMGENPENSDELIEIYDEIESITIDRHLDSNNDGISDYYTKLICDGKLTTGTGKGNLFGSATYEQVQGNADLDSDGLLNGVELEILENERGVYVHFHSDPSKKDSDLDKLTDFEETMIYGTSNFKYNGFVLEEDVGWAVDSENFISEKYRSLFDSKVLGALERGSVYIGNAFFGTYYDQSVLYQIALAEYLASVAEDLHEYYKMQYAYEAAVSLTGSILKSLKNVVQQGEEFTGVTVSDAYDFLDDILNTIPSESMGIFEDIYYEPIADELTNEKLQKLIDQVDHYKDQLLAADKKTFASSEDYQKYINEVIDKYSKASSEKIGFEGELNFYQHFKNAQTMFEVVGFVFTVVDYAQTTMDAYQLYLDISANLDVMHANIYILDVILAQCDDINLRIAASNLKTTINQMYQADRTTVNEFFFEHGGVVPLASKAFGDFVHFAIGKMGTPGAVVELVRTLGNLVFNMADVAEECSKLYAVAKTAQLLGNTYINYLEAGYGVLGNGKWVFYTTSNGQQLTYFLNLVVARNESEKQMIEADEANSFLIEWLFANIMYKVSECEENIERGKEIIEEYT